VAGRSITSSRHFDRSRGLRERCAIILFLIPTNDLYLQFAQHVYEQFQHKVDLFDFSEKESFFLGQTLHDEGDCVGNLFGRVFCSLNVGDVSERDHDRGDARNMALEAGKIVADEELAGPISTVVRGPDEAFNLEYNSSFRNCVTKLLDVNFSPPFHQVFRPMVAGKLI
jgi:hypothetical protein